MPAQRTLVGSTTPLVHVIVVNYNGAAHLPYCLPSIRATEYPNVSILLVDNASTDGSADAADASGTTTLRNSSNLGWSGGNNQGIRQALQAGAAYVVLANNDIRVHPRWIAEAVVVAESAPDVGVIGFDVHEPQPGDGDRDAGFTAACRAWSSTQSQPTASVGGMAMFVRSSVFEELGLIDENFFAYGEENDFQIRAARADYRIVSINVPVWHHGGGSFGRIPFRASLLQTQNNIQLLLKHHTISQLVKSAVTHVSRRVMGLGRPRPATSVERRLQSASVAQTIAVLVLATCGIALKAPAILRRRAEDRRRIEAARTKHLGEGWASSLPTALT